MSVLSVNADRNEEMPNTDLKGLEYILSCTACHGIDGNSKNPEWPIIAGLNKIYIIKQLKDFRTDTRSNKEMTELAKLIPSDKIIEKLAQYFSMQKVYPVKEEKSKTGLVDLALGKEIFIGKRLDYGIPACTACHGKNGEGDTEGKYPRLVGQYRKYTIKQMKLFRSKERNNDVPAMMQNIAMAMDDEDIESVAAYIKSLDIKK